MRSTTPPCQPTPSRHLALTLGPQADASTRRTRPRRADKLADRTPRLRLKPTEHQPNIKPEKPHTLDPPHRAPHRQLPVLRQQKRLDPLAKHWPRPRPDFHPTGRDIDDLPQRAPCHRAPLSPERPLQLGPRLDRRSTRGVRASVAVIVRGGHTSNYRSLSRAPPIAKQHHLGFLPHAPRTTGYATRTATSTAR